MIISFAFGLIGALLILANSRFFRKTGIAVAILLVTTLLAAAGVYFILNYSKKMDTRMLFPLFAPLAALLLWFMARLIYKQRTGKEIILHIHGLFPVRHYERYVTAREKFITFILLIFSVIIPYLILIFAL